MKRVVIGVLAVGALIALLLVFVKPVTIYEDNAPIHIEADIDEVEIDAEVDPEFELAEEAYLEAKQELESVLNEREGDLDPEIAEPMEENIGFVEGAVVDLLAALTQDPDNESLKQMLLEMYRREVSMLKGFLDVTD